ncbi:M4 family metallopeptidase, partial [Nocardioides hankookensis]
GSAPSGDEAVDEAATGITGALALFAEVYGRASYDGAGAPVSLTVHYGQDYDNAFWDGVQLVFGDGDGRVFERFTKPVDVLGHELTHAVTEHTAGLVYEDQPGALNESVSDVFAACLKQRLLGQSADQADWLIGAGIFVPGIAARALRDMAAPGTAYDDPALGRDPQVGHLDDYVSTSEDNGGVHLNS